MVDIYHSMIKRFKTCHYGRFFCGERGKEDGNRLAGWRRFGDRGRDTIKLAKDILHGSLNYFNTQNKKPDLNQGSNQVWRRSR
ncbi:MAG: hypothetical protein II867_03300, partial [Clostridia bacterium]|nr:hypothetical protein [Clostridia bacterium]